MTDILNKEIKINNDMNIHKLLNIGANDCYYYQSILNDEEKTTMFDLIKKEVNWGTMSHKGGDVSRLINIQSSVIIDDRGLIKYPLYRHPVDEHPKQVEFTSYVEILKDRTEDIIGVKRDYFNHCLVQLYRN